MSKSLKLKILKWDIIIALAIILAFTGVGFMYAYIDKPTYSVSELALYKAKILESQDSPYDYTATKSYLDTVADFCSSGVVLERANYYYDNYLQNKSKYQSVDDYVKEIKEQVSSSYSYEEVKENPSLFLNKQVVIEAKMYIGTGDGFRVQSEKFIGVFNGFDKKQDKNGGVVVEGVMAEVINLSHIVDGNDINLRTNQYFLNGSTLPIDYYKLKENKLSEYQNTTNYAFINDMYFSDHIAKVESDKNYIVKENLNVSASSGKDDVVSFAMTISYADENQIVAMEKAKIIILALDNESKVCEPFSERGLTVSDYLSGYKYFGVRVSVTDWGTLGASPSFTKRKRILVLSLIGVFVAGLTVGAKTLVEVKKKSKEEK